MENNVDAILSGMILSVSGWRGVFSAWGEDAGYCLDIPPERRLFAAAAALVFSAYLKDLGRTGDILIGRDTRPTGRAITNAIIPVLLDEGWTVRLVNESAAPEIMAYTRSLGEKDPLSTAGFIYISASHNPEAHNGLKFGLTDGGVLADSEMSILIDKLKTLLGNNSNITRLEILLHKSETNIPDIGSVNKVISESLAYKGEALKAYENFTQEVITGYSRGKEAEEVLALIRRGVQEHPLGIVADFNGSARTVSIDRVFFTGLGIGFRSIYDIPGIITHTIVPEGESLNHCRDFLETCHWENPFFIFGYKPDCDGDRGNLVVWDHYRARPLEAQETFALACVAELSYLVWTGQLKYDEKGKALGKAALVVNDPTSLRIDRIAQAFGIPVFRAEVGEANVVSLARKLREEGYLVRILGEGSNGGSIVHPAAVRDPLNTLGALIKLYTIRSKDDRKGLFEIWLHVSGQDEKYKGDFQLADILASLPAYISTGVSSDEAMLKVKTSDHCLLKEKYQRIFLKEWEERKEELKTKYGILSWDACAYNGIEEKPNLDNFGEAGHGGLKIGFLNKEGRKIASIWMRGSKTEPVFRIMADAEGMDRGFERDLIEWQTRMITQADET